MTPLNCSIRVLVIATPLLLWSTATIVHAGRIASDPYAGVDWGNDYRLKTQFHDHVRLSEDRITSYDDAGYDVVSFMHYSGTRSINAAWTELHWPPEEWLPEEFLAGLESIRFFLPNTELGAKPHLLTPFLATYIEEWVPAADPTKQPYQFESTQEAIELVRSLGGLPILPHPVEDPSYLDGYHAMEVYSAFMSYEFFKGANARDLNEDMLSFWDEQLMENPTLYAVAVNDWYGPWAADYPYDPAPPPSIVDSGKTIVISQDATMSSFRDAVESGAMFAVKDIGETKDVFPQIDVISVGEDAVTIGTADHVTWISNGQEVGSGPVFDTSTLGSDAVYLRAEIQNTDGSTVYTQPWAIKPSASSIPLRPGDADQDLDFDQLDLIRVLQGAKYLTGQTATWGEGDWNGAPGGRAGNPPSGDGVFDQLDVIAAHRTHTFRSGPYATLAPSGAEVEERTSISYRADTGEVWIDAPDGSDFATIQITSNAAIFDEGAARNLSRSLDRYTENEIFLTTLKDGLSSLHLGAVAQPGLSEEFVLADLELAVSLHNHGNVSDVDLVYFPVPEPSSLWLVIVGVAGLLAHGRERHHASRRLPRLGDGTRRSRPGLPERVGQ